jgi:hypothetical protein
MTALAAACAEPRAAPSPPVAGPLAPPAPELEPEPEPEPPAELRVDVADAADADGAIAGPCVDTLKRWTDVTGGATQVSVKVGTCSPPCRRTVRGEYFSRTHGTFPDRLSDLQQAANQLDVEIVEFTPQEDGSLHLIVECVES